MLENYRNLTLQELNFLLQRNLTSPADILESSFACIEKLNPRYNAFITLREKKEALLAVGKATQAARESIEKRCLLSLLGIPIAVKDMISFQGYPVTSGTKAIRKYPAKSAAIVDKLEDAGAVIVGKTNMHELAHGITSENPHFGTVLNPWGTRRMAGGSSGGSAVAVATGMVPAALGSDTAGSIRIPAAFCGVYGFKPSQGLLSMSGCQQLSPSLDHLGLFTRSVDDMILLFEKLTSLHPNSTPHKKYKIGVPYDFFTTMITENTSIKLESFLEKVATCGGEIETVDIPILKEAQVAGTRIVFKETTASYGYLLENKELLGKDIAACLQMGNTISDQEYTEALQVRDTIKNGLGKIFQSYDFLIIPSVPFSAPLIGTKKVMIQKKEWRIAEPLTTLNYPATLGGVPVISIPQTAKEELPLGFQIIAGFNNDALLLKFALALEEKENFPV